MKKIICFICVAFFALNVFLSNSFYISAISMDDDFLNNSEKIYEFQNSEYFTGSSITLCTGGISLPRLFNLYSSTNQNNPAANVLKTLNTDAVLPNGSDVQNGAAGMLQSFKELSFPVLVSDGKTESYMSSYEVFEILGKKICILNITAVPSDWYEKIGGSSDFRNFDYLIFFMDNPDNNIIPQSLRSKSVVLGRKTAVYRVDLQFGILLTEMNLPQEKTEGNPVEKIVEDFDEWKNTPFDISKYEYQYYFGISFYNNLALMLKKDYGSDLVLIEHTAELKSEMYPEELVSAFSDYVIGVVHLENSSIRKLLERSSANIEYDGININTVVGDYYLSVYGEPYYLDITQLKGERVIIKTFDKAQKIAVFMKKSDREKLFPKAKDETASVMPYVFWSAKSSDVSTIPSWRAVALPYFSNYVVQEGDTISGIANMLGITVSSIKTYNPDVMDMYLVPGSYLKVHVPYEFE